MVVELLTTVQIYFSSVSKKLKTPCDGIRRLERDRYVEVDMDRKDPVGHSLAGTHTCLRPKVEVLWHHTPAQTQLCLPLQQTE
eukprot:822898-Amphidinium_carterae.1